MRIRFQKLPGNDSLGIISYWWLEMESDGPIQLADHFIPELFFDFIHVAEGALACAGQVLPGQFLNTLHTRGRIFSAAGAYRRIVLMGARLAMSFADMAWLPLPGNAFLPVEWVDPGVKDLAAFSRQAAAVIEGGAQRKAPPRLLGGNLSPTQALAAYSPRHARRLVRQRYGISLKKMEAIRDLHVFLGHTCDFSLDYPRIIQHIDTEAFYDQPHLNKKFKKMTGLSPLEYFEVGGILQENLMAVSYNEN